MPNPLYTAIAAFITLAGNAAVAFGAFGANQATVVESAAVGLLAIVFTALTAHTAGKVQVAKIQALGANYKSDASL